jgi:hypothetical protein
MHLPGTYYQASGQFKRKPLIIATLAGILIAIFIGWLYYLLSRINPFIYVNFIVLVLALLACGAAFPTITILSESRNTRINVLISVLFCYLAWSSQWAFFNMHWHYGYSFWGGVFNPLTTLKIISTRGDKVDIDIANYVRDRFPFGGGFQYLLYLAELGVFMFAAKWITSSKDYYCEDCKQFYMHQEAHILEPEIDNFYLLKEMAGEEHHYQFLPQLMFVKKLTPVYVKKKPVMQVKLHYCAKCHQNNIVSVSSFMQATDDNNQNKATLTDEQPITVGMYIAKGTAEALHRKFV